MTSPFENEFSRPIVLLQIGDRDSRHTIEASPSEREALAKRLELGQLDRLSGEVALRRVRGGTALSATGAIHAEFTQICVATLEPLPGQLDEGFQEIFLLPDYHPAAQESVVDLIPDEELESGGPELFSAGSFDLGELLVQLLAERLDPYPRNLDAPATGGEWGEGEATEPANPFADLARKLHRQ